jgi:prepilin-type N-terminal cleavage/methylation domain-containing protein
MLKINKILSKKIKFPLSLRGLFPFCHSRESGNPSFLSFRGVKQQSNLNHNGFSLIELMVAITILAMAIFGIFHAYSVGFMGMADARDITVATNYAREAMEGIKNMDFDQVIPQSRYFINGTKYEREVIVQSETNLKEITTKVYWKDRNGTWKMVETDMVIHFIETTAGIPTRIMLIANPYNVLTEDDGDTDDVFENRSIIVVVVKDAKGNTVTTYNNNITFTLNDINNSFLINSLGNNVGKTYSVNAEQGIATVTFQASDTEGDVTIEASDSGLTSDSVTIKVTDPSKPVKINLTASSIFMIPESISIITATVVNAGGAIVESATNEITFSVSDPDLGTLSNQSLLISGVATIDLNSSAIPGTITVTASSSGLEPGVLDVITGGQISISAFPSPVHNEEKSEITVTTKDVNGVPINYVGSIQLHISPNPVGSGIFEDNSSDEIIIYFAEIVQP